VTTQTVCGDRYELRDVIGSGGMALVYLARDRKLDSLVAVKLLADNLSADPELRERFRREAELARRLSHPNVVRVLGSGETDGRAFIVLEFVECGNLAEELARAGPLSRERVAELGAQAAAGLAHAHERGLVHRDVKPQNLLLAADGTLKVSDFGIAHAVDGTRLTAIGSVLGTAAYLAPEQARSEETTAACDVYALGVVLRELSGGTPDDLQGLVGACLRDDPAARPTAREVELVLRGEREAPTRRLPSAPAAPTSVMRRPRSRRARTLVAAAACAVAVALAIGIGIGAGAGGRGAPGHEPAVVPPIPRAATPAASAEAFARWLRARSR
jgi:serine/threonine-protein kinase